MPSWSKRQATVIPFGLIPTRIVQLGRQRVRMVPDQVDGQPAVDLLGREEGFPVASLLDGAGQRGRLPEHAIAGFFQHGTVDVHGLVVKCRLVLRGQVQPQQHKDGRCRQTADDEQRQAQSAGHVVHLGGFTAVGQPC